MSDTPALPVTFQPGHTRAVLHTLGAASFVTITVIALVLGEMSAGEKFSFIFTAALFWGVLALLARPKVVADDEGVTVVNIARSRRLAWAEIVQVNLRPGDPWVFLNLTDGTSMAAMGIQPGLAKKSAIRDAKALRALAESRGTVQG
ncbi:PH domain-containing protein [Streptomyces sp. VRA16 Mangrove soil]|uniref:PH domain-containing protein n=1 Tax=Streptomyces sp. VRA16 Mangrove soil TaxID=2817434 RepID=UPI001A9E7925|nr:PH domain-containing protein [Streptomyces sp. VRA16 Mangrove soil]MBO1331531.1 PH domain-containing protein [Streptomyces sp. VRA16 Mangrove soil]